MFDTSTVPNIVDQLIILENRTAAAYERTLKGMPDGQLRLNCSGILRAHRLAAQLLNGRLDGGAMPESGSSIPTIDISAPEPRGLAFLVTQERLVILEYENVLEQPTIGPGTRSLIETALLPESREHLEKLEEILQAFAASASEAEQALAAA